MKNKYLLIAIIFLSLFLRLYNVSQNPAHLNWDEASIGYNAYSVLETGKDEWGKSFPIIFRAYGDYKLPVYLYTSVPFISVFGLNAFSVRLASVLAGVTTVIFTYLLSKFVFKSERVSLFASLLMAVEPWGLFLSRIALEANLALALVVSGLFFLLNSLETRNKTKFLLSSILLGLSVWTYNSARVFVPLITFSGLFIFRHSLYKDFKKYVWGIAILLLFFIPMFWQLSNSEGSARYENVKILDQGALGRIIEQRQNSQLPGKIPRLLHNRPVYFTKEYLGNYLSHFSTSFLYKDGGNHYQFNIPGNGLFYEFNLIFMIFGITYLSFLYVNKKNIDRRYLKFFLLWLLFAPVASSLTRESPHSLRNILFLPMPIIISAVGFNFVSNIYKNKGNVFSLLYILLIFLFSFSYIKTYFEDYRKDYSWAWQYGHSQVVDYISENYDNYEQIIITKKYGEPHEFLLFYGSKNNQDWAKPGSYQNDNNLNRFYQSNWYWVDSFDKFFFVNDWEIPKNNEQPFVLESGSEIPLKGNVLFITSPGNYPIRFINKKNIYFLDGKPAFDIVTAEFN